MRRGDEIKGPGISDHALLRFLERAGLADVEQLREALSLSLTRAYQAARALGDTDHLIKIGGMTFVVRGDTVTTVMETGSARDQASHLRPRQAKHESGNE